jgi:hypothetical protein
MRWEKKEKDYDLNVRNCNRYWKKWVKKQDEREGIQHNLEESCRVLGAQLDFPGRFNKTFRHKKPTEKHFDVPYGTTFFKEPQEFTSYHNLGGRRKTRRR